MTRSTEYLACLDRREAKRIDIVGRYRAFVGKEAYHLQLEQAGYPGNYGPERHVALRKFYARIFRWYRGAASSGRPI